VGADVPQKSKVGLGELRRRLQAFQGQARIGSGDARGEVEAPLGALALRKVLDGFKGSHDPYGVPWAPVARGGKPLVDTGAMRASTTVAVTADGFKVAVADRVAQFHQYGTRGRRPTGGKRRRGAGGRFLAGGRRRGIRPRPMLPTAARGMPPSWRVDFARATRAVLRRISQGGR
jgi:phage gpG-like protein